MNVWLTEFETILKALFGNAGKATQVEQGVACMAALIGLYLVLKWTGRTFGAKMPDPGRVVIVMSLGLVLGLASAVAANIYGAPLLKNSPLLPWLPLAAALIANAVIVLPAACLIMKGRFIPLFFASALSIAAAFGVIVLVHAAFDAFHEGDRGFKKTRERTESVNDMLKK